jgi:hypothetical protein
MNDTNLVELADLEQVIERHWRQHRPTMYAELQERGELEASIRQAADNTRGAVRQLMDEQGMPFLFAWEAVREEWAILPAEEDGDEGGDAAAREAMDAILEPGVEEDDRLWSEDK